MTKRSEPTPKNSTTDPPGPDEARHVRPLSPEGRMNERTRDWLDRAGNARSVGDLPTADFCQEQADWWASNYENAERIKVAIERLETGRDTISAEQCARIAAEQAKRWAGALELLGRNDG